MSDIERTKGLMNTDDPELWAEEFVRIFDGKVVGDDIEEGDMLVWFANAMQVAIDVHGARKLRIESAELSVTDGVPESARDGFVEGVNDGREPRPSDTDARD